MNLLTTYRRLALLPILLLLAVSLACNFPMLLSAQPRQPEEPGLPQTEPPFFETAPVAPDVTPTPPVPSPTPTEAIEATFSAPVSDEHWWSYPAQPGDTLAAVAGRFGVETDQVASAEIIPPEAYIPSGQILTIPNLLGEVTSAAPLLPDGEVIYSPSTVGFDIRDFIAGSGGFLSAYEEEVEGEWLSGAQIVQRVAEETSTNPRLLLSFLEYRSGWVTGEPENSEKIVYPIGFYVPGYRGLYLELSLAAKQLNIGYYGWRLGTLTELVFPDGSRRRLNPTLNAGTAAVQYLFSKFYRPALWDGALYSADNFFLHHFHLFGDAWERSAASGPLLDAALAQPDLELPFAPGERWSFTGGPHRSWNTGTPLGALDFSPVTGDPPCLASGVWVTASAGGVVTRSERNLVVLDLDGDGYEQTGWVLFYLHVADRDRIGPGARVAADAQIGHPSCEGGSATGTHVHIARKYNGEWLSADGPVPFVLSGWRAANGSRYYEGYLIKDDQMVASNPGGSRSSIIIRQP
jgi:murein DD-endopeptidase MepM/ murein hydrolase activator NlpD